MFVCVCVCLSSQVKCVTVLCVLSLFFFPQSASIFFSSQIILPITSVIGMNQTGKTKPRTGRKLKNTSRHHKVVAALKCLCVFLWLWQHTGSIFIIFLFYFKAQFKLNGSKVDFCQKRTQRTWLINCSYPTATVHKSCRPNVHLLLVNEPNVFILFSQISLWVRWTH